MVTHHRPNKQHMSGRKRKTTALGVYLPFIFPDAVFELSPSSPTQILTFPFTHIPVHSGCVYVSACLPSGQNFQVGPGLLWCNLDFQALPPHVRILI